MAAWTTAARRIVPSHKPVSTAQIASLTHRRGFAAGGGINLLHYLLPPLLCLQFVISFVLHLDLMIGC